jgi:branched-chain amino acid transport system substrate-binding protein
MKRVILTATMLAFGAIGAAGGAAAQEYIKVGNLIDLTGATALVGQEYGQGKVDAMNYINENGGINGKLLDFDTVDYSYVVPRAVATYKKWVSQDEVVAIQGWGTGDTEALIEFVAKDQIPYISASYSGHLTDPTGKNPNTKKPAPYNFFVGPSYSDGCRGLVQWAAEDWKSKGGSGAAKYVHMGDNHPYPNAPKKACEEYAAELGFEVLPSIGYTLAPADFKAQCLSLKESGANYAFLANTSDANVALLKSCGTVGTEVQFMANIWGYDENVMKAAGEAADGVVWAMGAAKWGDDVPGMDLVRQVSAMSDPKGVKYRAVHYIRGVCSIFYMKEAMEAADQAGGITGPNIKAAMESKTDWVPAGLDGVCLPATWTAEDHRGMNTVLVYRGTVKGATDGSIVDLVKNGTIGMEQVYAAEIPRKPEWLGY